MRRCSASSAALRAVWPGSSPDAISTTAAESSAFFCSSPSPLLMTMRLALDLRSHAVGFLCCFLLLLGKLQSRLRQRIRPRLHLIFSHRAMSEFPAQRQNELKGTSHLVPCDGRRPSNTSTHFHFPLHFIAGKDPSGHRRSERRNTRRQVGGQRREKNPPRIP